MQTNLAYSVAIFVLLGVALSKDILTGDFMLLYLIVPVYFVTSVLYHLYGNLRSFYKNQKMMLQDNSYIISEIETIDLNEEAESKKQELLSIGFSELGKAHMSRTDGFSCDMMIMSDADETTIASICSESEPKIEFITYYEDSAKLATLFPNGFERNTPLIQIYVVSEDLGQAYQSHLHHNLPFQAIHGKPIVVASLQRYLQISKFDPKTLEQFYHHTQAIVRSKIIGEVVKLAIGIIGLAYFLLGTQDIRLRFFLVSIALYVVWFIVQQVIYEPLSNPKKAKA